VEGATESGTAVTPECTELEWVYLPSDFFEATYQHAQRDHDLHIEGGRAVATLRTPQDPVDQQLENRIQPVIPGHENAALRMVQLAAAAGLSHVSFEYLKLGSEERSNTIRRLSEASE
jgi:hypothetical protein